MVRKRLECGQQSVIAPLNQIQEVHVAARITLRNRNYHGKVRFDQGLARRFHVLVVAQHVSGELEFLVLRQRWNGADFAQIDLNRIVIESRRVHVASVSRVNRAERRSGISPKRYWVTFA